jgi:hypothetical protein
MPNSAGSCRRDAIFKGLPIFTPSHTATIANLIHTFSEFAMRSRIVALVYYVEVLPIKTRGCAVKQRGRHDKHLLQFPTRRFLLSILFNLGAADSYYILVHLCNIHNDFFNKFLSVKHGVRLGAFHRTIQPPPSQNE